MMPSAVSPWSCALELRRDRSVAAGGYHALCAAIACGADLRVYTEFTYEEHLAPFMTPPQRPEQRCHGLIREVIDFRQTFLVDGRHAAGVTTLRQPLLPTVGFNGAQPKMSFFLYHMDGSQACAQLLLDATRARAKPGRRALNPPPPGVPRMSEEEAFDLGTTGPSRNFIYDMEVYRFFVRDDWTEVLAHDERGRVTRGSFEALHEAQRGGREIKVGVRGLCDDLAKEAAPLPHEVFSNVGSGFLHTRLNTYETLTHPIVRVRPGVPMKYASFAWDVSWVALRSDGFAVRRTLDPYTRTWRDHETRLAMRWFVR